MKDKATTRESQSLSRALRRAARARRSLATSSSDHVALVSSHHNANSAGLPALPIELIEKIVGYIPGIPFPCTDEEFEREDTFFRSQTLLSLSLTCRWLRANVLRFTWQSLEICRMTREQEAQGLTESEALAYQLLEKIEVVTIREPAYASTVQCVSRLPLQSLKQLFTDYQVIHRHTNRLHD
jgi:hypothetical protein